MSKEYIIENLDNTKESEVVRRLKSFRKLTINQEYIVVNYPDFFNIVLKNCTDPELTQMNLLLKDCMIEKEFTVKEGDIINLLEEGDIFMGEIRYVETLNKETYVTLKISHIYGRGRSVERIETVPLYKIKENLIPIGFEDTVISINKMIREVSILKENINFQKLLGSESLLDIHRKSGLTGTDFDDMMSEFIPY